MHIKKNYVEISYGLFLLLFLIITFFYIKRPRLKDFLIKNTINSTQYIQKIKVDFDLSNSLKRSINVGQSYLVSINKDTSFKITNIALGKIHNFNLLDYSEYLPNLVNNYDRINIEGRNNYAIHKLKNKIYYQTCIFDINDSFYIYKKNPRKEINRYNDYAYWREIYKREIIYFLKFNNEPNNCLLVTTDDPKLFDNDLLNLNKIIKKFFIYN